MSARGSGLGYAFGAVALWSTSAVSTHYAVTHAPALLVVAVAFTVATIAGASAAAARGRLRQVFRARPLVWLVGLYGLSSYYLAYFIAFGLAPAMEVNLLNYLWPLLTVLLSVPLTGQSLRARVVVGALVAFAGAGLVVTQGHLPQLSAAHATGYALALWCGVTWAVFSCLLNRLGAAASGRMTLFCALTAAVAWPAALVSGAFPTPVGLWCLAAVYSGVAPLWLAFELWDRALQQPDVARVGLISYTTPALSTLILALAGERLTLPSVLGLIAIIGGAALGAAGRRADPLQPKR